MRTLSLAALLLLLPPQLIAAELISEPHAMLYYRVPLDGSKLQQRQHSFGLRMDRASFNADEMPEQHQLFEQAALFDLKLNARGLEGIYLSGNALLENPYLNRADEDGGESAVKRLQDAIDNMPFGVFLGAAIGTLILSGVGG